MQKLSLYYSGLLVAIITLFTLGTIAGMGPAQLGQSCLDMIVALLAIFIGIPVALEVERQRKAADDEAEMRLMLEAIRTNLYRNIGFVLGWYPGALLFNRSTGEMDLTALEATAYERHRMVKDFYLKLQIDQASWHLARLCREMDKVEAIEADQRTAATNVNKQSLATLLLSKRETRAMGILLQASPNHEVAPALAARLLALRNVTSSAFGLTDVDSTERIAQGGAIAACADAIRSIDAVLPDPGDTLENMLKLVESLFSFLEAQVTRIAEAEIAATAGSNTPEQ